jgi:hypothetical protein
MATQKEWYSSCRQYRLSSVRVVVFQMPLVTRLACRGVTWRQGQVYRTAGVLVVAGGQEEMMLGS